MSPAFISGIEENFPEASITFDKFHVMASQPELKHSRYVWLKNQENLTEKQKKQYAN